MVRNPAMIALVWAENGKQFVRHNICLQTTMGKRALSMHPYRCYRWSPTTLRSCTSPHASSGGTLRSVPSFAKATEGTHLAFIHGFTPVAFCEGGEFTNH